MATNAPERRRRAAPAKAPHDATINVRMSSATRNMIDAAATSLGKSRSEFVTESARRRAVDVLLDQRLFMLSPDEFAAFETALDHPPPPNDQLKALLKRQPLWDK